MTTFVIASLCVFVLSLIGEFYMLSQKELPLRRRSHTTIDAVINVLFIIWGISVLT